MVEDQLREDERLITRRADAGGGHAQIAAAKADGRWEAAYHHTAVHPSPIRSLEGFARGPP